MEADRVRGESGPRHRDTRQSRSNTLSHKSPRTPYMLVFDTQLVEQTQKEKKKKTFAFTFVDRSRNYFEFARNVDVFPMEKILGAKLHLEEIAQSLIRSMP